MEFFSVLTDYMEQSPSEANSHSTRREIHSLKM